MPENSVTTTFNVGEDVIYPMQGLGTVQAIEHKEFRGEPVPYYIIFMESSDMTVMVPTDKVDERRIRPIVTKEQAYEALDLVSKPSDPVPSDWKARYQMNVDLLRDGSVFNIARVVRTLYHRSKIKELPILERRLYDTALKMLIAEIASSLASGRDEVEQLIHERLEAEKAPPPAVEADPEFEDVSDFDDE